MTREIAENLPMIELAEMLIDYSDVYEGMEAYELVEEGLDRYDTLEELETLGAFDEDKDKMADFVKKGATVVSLIDSSDKLQPQNGDIFETVEISEIGGAYYNKGRGLASGNWRYSTFE